MKKLKKSDTVGLKDKQDFENLETVLNKMETRIDETDIDDIKWAEKEYDAGMKMRATKMKEQLKGQDPLVFNPKELVL